MMVHLLLKAVWIVFLVDELKKFTTFLQLKCQIFMDSGAFLP